MNILKLFHPVYIPEAVSKAKTKAHRKDVWELGKETIQHDHPCHGPESDRKIKSCCFF